MHNDGPPIAPTCSEQVFEPFRRGDAAGNAWGGVGLGLYIVKQIVAAHGGAVVGPVRGGGGNDLHDRAAVDAARAASAPS